MFFHPSPLVARSMLLKEPIRLAELKYRVLQRNRIAQILIPIAVVTPSLRAGVFQALDRRLSLL